MSEIIEFTRIRNDVNGNPRYVCHFFDLCTRAELDATGESWIPIGQKYVVAAKRANRIGGRRYHTRTFGGGIAFQSYALDELIGHISSVTGRKFTGYTVR